jgi:hypothetical protein
MPTGQFTAADLDSGLKQGMFTVADLDPLSRINVQARQNMAQQDAAVRREIAAGKPSILGEAALGVLSNVAPETQNPMTDLVVGAAKTFNPFPGSIEEAKAGYLPGVAPARRVVEGLYQANKGFVQDVYQGAGSPSIGFNHASVNPIQPERIAHGLGGLAGEVAMLATMGLKPKSGFPGKYPGSLAERMYQSALKPSTANPARAARVSATGLAEHIPVSETGAAKIGALVNELNAAINSKIQAGASRGVTVDPRAVAARTAQLEDRFRTQVTPAADLADIAAARDEFLKTYPEPIPATRAQAVKVGTYRQLQKSYGKLSGAAIESQKALARGIKEELASQFPEITDLNAREGRLLDLQPALEKAVARIQNRNLISLGGRVASAGAGPMAALAGGDLGTAALSSAGTLVLHEVITNPAVQSRLAMIISRTSGGRIPLSAAMVRIGAYATAVGQLANAPSSQGEPHPDQ